MLIKELCKLTEKKHNRDISSRTNIGQKPKSWNKKEHGDKKDLARKNRKETSCNESVYYGDDEELSDVDPMDRGNRVRPGEYPYDSDESIYDTKVRKGEYNNEITDADLRKLGVSREQFEKVKRFIKRGYGVDYSMDSQFGVKAYANMPETDA